jgi:hypothetical protein
MLTSKRISSAHLERETNRCPVVCKTHSTLWRCMKTGPFLVQSCSLFPEKVWTHLVSSIRFGSPDRIPTSVEGTNLVICLIYHSFGWRYASFMSDCELRCVDIYIDRARLLNATSSRLISTLSSKRGRSPRQSGPVATLTTPMTKRRSS